MAGFQKMIDMARSPDDIKKDMGIPAPVAAKLSGPMYPYGLCIRLDDETLKKLGIAEMPDVGEMIQISGMGKVTCASETSRENTDGTAEQCRSVEVQLTHLGIEDENREAEPRGERWYGADNEPDEA